ncbi:MAG: efflux RND transporter periplasmic adaptor subunit [Kastovskya adunca ATA6-11-RM4]|jgi:RND family efflux transporter MFP subunit|nr:efflux RND transporter periplasmic adaptor subunit [Kastovskya adunca ATA6-11-RM4]
MIKVGALPSGKSLGATLFLLILTSACSRGEPPLGAGAPQGVPVKLASVETTTVEESSEFVGTLEAEQSVVLRPETDGRVSRIYVSSGSNVAEGTPILQLRPDKGRAEVGGAIANVSAARAARDNSQAQLRAIEAERASAVADLALQNDQYGRISRLVSQGALARQQLDQVRRDRDAARAALNATDQRIQAARASLDQANATLQQSQANADLAREELQETQVTAPIAGVVGDITADIGDYVKAGDTLTTIIQNQALNLRLAIPVERSSQLRSGLPVQLVGSDNEERMATGRISFVAPQVSAGSQSILAKANFPNPEGQLRSGQFVRAKIIWNRRPNSVVVPTTAVIFQGEERYVYVAEDPEKLVARRQVVELGLIQGDRAEVQQGLKGDERIIVSGTQKLSDGAPILPLEEEDKVSQQSQSK